MSTIIVGEQSNNSRPNTPTKLDSKTSWKNQSHRCALLLQLLKYLQEIIVTKISNYPSVLMKIRKILLFYSGNSEVKNCLPSLTLMSNAKNFRRIFPC